MRKGAALAGVLLLAGVAAAILYFSKNSGRLNQSVGSSGTPQVKPKEQTTAQRVVEAAALPSGFLQSSAQGIKASLIPWQAKVNEINAVNKQIDAIMAVAKPLYKERSRLKTETAYIVKYPGATAAQGLASRHAAIDALTDRIAPYEAQISNLEQMKKALNKEAVALRRAAGA